MEEINGRYEFIVDLPNWKTFFRAKYHGDEHLYKFMSAVYSTIYLKFLELLKDVDISFIEGKDIKKEAQKLLRKAKLPKEMLPFAEIFVIERSMGLKIHHEAKEIKKMITK